MARSRRAGSRRVAASEYILGLNRIAICARMSARELNSRWTDLAAESEDWAARAGTSTLPKIRARAAQPVRADQRRVRATRARSANRNKIASLPGGGDPGSRAAASRSWMSLVKPRRSRFSAWSCFAGPRDGPASTAWPADDGHPRRAVGGRERVADASVLNHETA